MLLFLSLTITAEILLRRFANFSLQGSDELGGYTLAIVGAFGFSLAALERAHTRVEILVERVASGPRAILNLLAMFGTMLMALFMAWRGWAALMESIEFKSLSGTPLMTPLWLPQSIWVFGLIVFAVVTTALFVHATILFYRNREQVNKLYGLKTVTEILEEECIETSVRGAK
ncbi:TRAP transporter small permease subunit [Pseudoruegeria sp. SK021]|uniref:TRAP transporter small permease subunit n=1 Tax=Pseudoruegeria sp. SK021 TaxID=1933035 RepID=UPI001F0AA111|nr:TRAP transporter small permease [Pseudoruegeria sp. SK021]